MIIQGYPNYADEHPQSKADLTKWIDTLKNIHIKANLGQSRTKITDELIKDWDRMEQRDFKDWMRYYESGDANKYKIAQMSYYVNDNNGYFLPNPQNQVPPTPIKSINDQIAGIPQEAQTLVQQTPERLPEVDKRKMVEDHRRKLMGRLHAAEKLLTSQQGQMFAGADFERLLKAIYDLKRDIQLTNKTSLSSETCVDLIIRQANILTRDGSEFGAQFMMKLAQNNPGNFGMQLGDTPVSGSAPQGQGALTNNDPSMSMLNATPPDDKKDEEEPTDGLDGFLANMEGAGVTLFEDKNEIEDDVFMNDNNEVLDQEIDMADDGDIVVEAQFAPRQDAKIPAEPRKPRPEKQQELGGKDPITPDLTMPDEQKVGKPSKDVDALIESAFAGITIEDVISKMEDIANIFRNREISRQLAIVDIMLDRLGVSQFFPELSECSNKSLDSSNYCLTRMDNILSRLRGSTNTADLDLAGKNNKVAPQAQGLANSLQKSDQEEKQRKDMKKQLDTQQMESKLKPEPEVEGVGEELTAPGTNIEQPAPRQQRPVAPPGV